MLKELDCIWSLSRVFYEALIEKILNYYFLFFITVKGGIPFVFSNFQPFCLWMRWTMGSLHCVISTTMHPSDHRSDLQSYWLLLQTSGVMNRSKSILLVMPSLLISTLLLLRSLCIILFLWRLASCSPIQNNAVQFVLWLELKIFAHKGGFDAGGSR